MTQARVFSHLLAGGEARRIASAHNVEARGGGIGRRCRCGRVSGNDRRRCGCRRQNARHNRRDEAIDAVAENWTGKANIFWRFFERWNNGR